MSSVRVFVAGGSGALGRRLVPQLVARGHRVTATTTSPDRLGLLEGLGADGMVLDALDGASVGEAVATARPDAIVHLMTALSAPHAGAPNVKHMDRWFGPTNRLRTEGTDNLLAAAEATDVPHVVAQSYAGWNGIRAGGWVKTEDDPLDMHEGTVQNAISVAVRYLEDVVLATGGAVLRYGSLYGDASDDLIETGLLAALWCAGFAGISVWFELTEHFATGRYADDAPGLSVANWFVTVLKLGAAAVALLAISRTPRLLTPRIVGTLLWAAFATLALYGVGSIAQAVVLLTGTAGEADQIDSSAVLYVLAFVLAATGFGILAISYARRARLDRRVMWIGACGAPLVLVSVLVIVPAILRAVGLLSGP